MASPSPLERSFRDAGAVLIPYGPQDDAAPGVAMVGACGPIELEYASIRKHCGLLDLPMRGVIELRGPERADFLNRMITQEMKGLAPGRVRRSFWLNRKGRIDADLRVIHLENRTLLDVDILAGARTAKGLDSFIISEDASVRDISQSTHRMALHGPTASELLARTFTPDQGQPAIASLAQDVASQGTIAGQAALTFRDDSAGVPGFELLCEAHAASAVARALIEVGHDARHATHDEPGRAIALQQRDDPAASIRLQPIGWHAYNMARIEAGTPLYNLDFGPENLPAETGALHDRVSFTKGCYLGQEVVARMHARGQSKQTLAAIRFERPEVTDTADDDRSPYPTLPDSGAPVAMHGTDASSPQVIGTITSAAPAPMLGMAPIAFAQLKAMHAVPGTVVVCDAARDGDMPPIRLRGVVQPSLRFWPSAAVVSRA